MSHSLLETGAFSQPGHRSQGELTFSIPAKRNQNLHVVLSGIERAFFISRDVVDSFYCRLQQLCKTAFSHHKIQTWAYESGRLLRIILPEDCS